MNLQTRVACMRENNREHDAEVQRQLCTQMLETWCSAKLLYVDIPHQKHQLHLNKGVSLQRRCVPTLIAGRLSSGVQVPARRVPPGAGQEPVCRIPGCKQSVGEGLIENRLESLGGVFVLSFSRRLGSPSGLQRWLHAFSRCLGCRTVSVQPALRSESVCSQWGKALSGFLLLFWKGTGGKQRS